MKGGCVAIERSQEGKANELGLLLRVRSKRYRTSLIALAADVPSWLAQPACGRQSGSARPAAGPGCLAHARALASGTELRPADRLEPRTTPHDRSRDFIGRTAPSGCATN